MYVFENVWCFEVMFPFIKVETLIVKIHSHKSSQSSIKNCVHKFKKTEPAFSKPANKKSV